VGPPNLAGVNKKLLLTGLIWPEYNQGQSSAFHKCRCFCGKIHFFQCVSGDGPSRRRNFRYDSLILQAFRLWRCGVTALASTETSCPVCSEASARVGVVDTARAFAPAADRDRRALVPRKVVRLYRNTTEEWVRLTWAEGGEPPRVYRRVKLSEDGPYGQEEANPEIHRRIPRTCG
jgi:hypothetical protein